MECPYCKGTGDLDASKASIAIMVHAAREKAGMTQEDLAARVGLSRAAIANIETGRARFDLNRLRAFAEALAVPVDALVP